MRIEEREYIEPESINEEIINAINTVKEYCSTHEEYEDCRRCVLGDVLSKFLNANVIAGTMTVPMDDVKDNTKETDRKHGYWVALDECANEGVYCSVCNKKIYKLYYANQKLKSKYCPNCGAIMDEKEES